MVCPDEIQDCDLMKLGLEQLFKKLLRLNGDCLSIQVKEASREVSFTNSVETNSTNSPVAAGAKAVSFTTSDDFVGTINGLARAANGNYLFPAGGNDTTPTIPYSVTSGSLTIEKTI